MKIDPGGRVEVEPGLGQVGLAGDIAVESKYAVTGLGPAAMNRIGGETACLGMAGLAWIWLVAVAIRLESVEAESLPPRHVQGLVPLGPVC